MARLGVRRGDHRVRPGSLRAWAARARSSPVFVTANYTLSFDALRSSLPGIDGYILVLDTHGINVWCAAGKGTFGTDELVRRIEATGLSDVVSHRRLILPQLGAPGVQAHEVRRRTGFRVEYGPVRAADLPAYLASRPGHRRDAARALPPGRPSGAGAGGDRAHDPADAAAGLPGVLCAAARRRPWAWWRRCWPAWRSSRRCCRGSPPPTSAARGSSWEAWWRCPLPRWAAVSMAPPAAGLLRAAGLTAGAAGRDGLSVAQLYRRHPHHVSQRGGGGDQDLHPPMAIAAGLGILLVLAALVPGLAGA